MVTTEAQDRHVRFPGQDQGEEPQFYFRQHWIRLLRPVRNMVLFTVLIGLAGWGTNLSFGGTGSTLVRHTILLFLCGGLVLAQMRFLVAFYKYFLYVVIITDKKIHRIKKTLITTDDHQSIDLWTLEDITKHQHGLFQNMLGFGTLVLMMQGQDALRIHFTPFIGRKHDRIMRLREHARRKLMPQQMMQAAIPSSTPGQPAEAMEKVMG